MDDEPLITWYEATLDPGTTLIEASGKYEFEFFGSPRKIDTQVYRFSSDQPLSDCLGAIPSYYLLKPIETITLNNS